MYNRKDFEDIDKSCPASASIGLGLIIDTAYDDITNGREYSGRILADSEVEKLDKMCSASDITDIAYVLNDILKASQDHTHLDELDDSVIDKINNGICSIFSNCSLGDKLEEMIEILNGGEPGEDIQFLTKNNEEFITSDDKNFIVKGAI